MDLKGKAALVTGSTSGIGKAIAERLASRGANIVLNGFGEPTAIERQRVDLAETFGVEVAFEGADLAKAGEARGMIERAVARFGAVDVLVNNAGVQFVSPIETFPPEKWDEIIAINLSASFHLIRGAVPAMKARKWGRIVNIASAHALVASPFKAAYVAAKHAIAGLTKTVALELATSGITANAVCPGYVWTPLVEKQIPETARARGISEKEVVETVLLHAQPTKAFVKVDEVAALTAYLASGEAASITGAIIPIDGGWTAQ
jgi:3-hydroxybutyrate dehydrogenase